MRITFVLGTANHSWPLLSHFLSAAEVRVGFAHHADQTEVDRFLKTNWKLGEEGVYYSISVFAFVPTFRTETAS